MVHANFDAIKKFLYSTECTCLIINLITGKNHGKAAQQGVAGAAAGLSDISYENIDPLSQPSAVKTTHMYENIPTVSSPHHQSNIEMNQCPAYGALM